MARQKQRTQPVVGNVIEQAHLKWYVDDKSYIQGMRLIAHKTARSFPQLVKYAARLAYEKGLLDGNG